MKKADKKLKDLQKKHDEIKSKLDAIGDPASVAKKAYAEGIAKAAETKAAKIADAKAKYDAKMKEIAAKYGKK